MGLPSARNPLHHPTLEAPHGAETATAPTFIAARNLSTMTIATPFRNTPLHKMLLGGLLAATPLMVTTALADEPRLRLDVQAEAQQEAVPDRATLNARLWERTPAIAQQDDQRSDPEALREARESLEQRAAKLIQTMEDAGVARDDINAGSLNVQPEYVPGPRLDNGEGQPMVRTRLERPFRVEIDDLEQLPPLLDALTEAGVDALDGITYDLSDRDAATDQALVAALEKARHKATLMADTLGIALGDVITVSETLPPQFQPRMMAMSADARESGAQNEYRPGTLSIEAGVSVSWAIEASDE